MKKLAGFIIIAALVLVSFSVCSAEDGMKLYWDGNTYTIGEGTTELSDEAAGIAAAIKVDKLDEDVFQALRDYYNDNKSTEDQLFEKYIKLQRSYIPAAQDLFHTSFLYGEQDDQASESNLKLFYDGSDSIFGQKSAVYLYNVFTSDRLDFNEETHLDLSIPLTETHSLISIGITVKCGSLNDSSIGKIMELLGAFRPEGLLPQTEKLLILKDSTILAAANAGIYPTRHDEAMELLSLQDTQAGFSLSYPSSYVPYMQNGLGGRLQYWSFKINPNHIFSISAEPLESGESPETAVKAVKELEGRDSVLEEGKQEIRGKPFSYVKYETTTTQGALYVSDYFTTDNSRLYRLQLSSRFEKPSASILEDFGKILESLSTQKPAISDPAGAPVPERYINKEEGYSFGYPKDWQLTDISDDINNDKFKLVFPELSGPLDITISEGEQKQPFDGRQTRLLNRSYRLEGSTLYTYRLLDYLDANGRNRLGYCIDISKGKKTYSMFIAVGEYETANGRLKDEGINSIINSIASSFQTEDTVETRARGAFGETRNRKIIFIEEWLKTNMDPGLKVTEAEKTAADGSIYVKVVSGESGYYKIKPDFENKKLEILDRTLTIAILKSELEKLKDTYKDRIITGTEINIPMAAISIDSQSDKNSPIFKRTYRVNVSCGEDGVKWETVRANHAEELRNECKSYMSYIFSADVSMQFSQADAFKDIETYEKSKTKYHTMVHIEFNNLDGYFVLEIDPSNDEIRPVSFKPMDLLLKEIDEKNGYGKNGFEITESSFESTNFILRITLRSTTDGALKSEDIKVQFNQEDLNIFTSI